MYLVMDAKKEVKNLVRVLLMGIMARLQEKPINLRVQQTVVFFIREISKSNSKNVDFILFLTFSLSLHEW